MANRTRTGRRGRPPLDESERRTRFLNLRANVEERRQIEANAERQHEDTATYVRKVAIRGRVRNTRLADTLMASTRVLETIGRRLRNAPSIDRDRLAEDLLSEVRTLRAEIPNA